jgi:hypothetical protein
MSDESLFLTLAVTMLSFGALRSLQQGHRLQFELSHVPVPSSRPQGAGWPTPRTMARLRRAFVRYGLPALILLCAAGAAYGGYQWYRTLGSICESHTLGEYRFKITSERDPDYEDYEGYIHDNVYVSVSQQGKWVVKRRRIGAVIDPTELLTFTVRQLPNESLIVVTPNDRETEIVFAYDTTTGRSYPFPYRDTTDEEDWKKHRDERAKWEAEWEARIRACHGYEHSKLGYLYRASGR